MITLFKTLAFASLSAICVLPSARAAVERETFEVFVEIPTAQFYVLPVDPTLVQRDQPLDYNPVSSQLKPLRAQFDVKNVSGAIGARLDAEPFLFNGRERIDLRVTFNNQELGLTSSEVVSSTDAAPGKRVALEIAAIKAADDYAPGNYYGTVHMVFDALAPGANP